MAKGNIIITDGDMMSMFSALAKETKKQVVHSYEPKHTSSGMRITKESVFATFDKFGDERMHQMMDSFENYNSGDWNGCAIARAFGEFGALNAAATKAGEDIVTYVMRFFQVTRQEVNAIVYLYDSQPTTLKSYVDEWLLLKKAEGAEVGLIMSVSQSQPEVTSKEEVSPNASPVESSADAIVA